MVMDYVSCVLPSDPVSARRRIASRADGVKSATGHVDVDPRALHGNYATRRKSHRWNNTRLATWNLRGLNQTGKLQIVQSELMRCGMDVVGISETHWQGSGHFKSSNYTVYYSGTEDRRIHGVGFLVSDKVNRAVMGYETINERMIMIKINSQPCIVNILQVYAPTSDADDELIEEFYSTVEDAIGKIPNKEILIIMGDFNAKVGSTLNDRHMRSVVGKYGLGDRNERGERLIQFGIDNNFTIANTVFNQHKRRLYTWRSPDGQYRNQIDYILIRQRWRSSIKVAKTLPSADCGTDHQLLMFELTAKLKSCRRNDVRQVPRVATEQIPTFIAETTRRIESDICDSTNMSVNGMWQVIKNAIVGTIRELPQEPPVQRKQPWLSAETMDLVSSRRAIKTAGMNEDSDLERYRLLSRRIQTNSRKDKNLHFMKICAELQEHADHNNTKDLFTKIRHITRKFKPRSWAVRDQDDNLISELDGIVGTWRNYCMDLYSDQPNMDTEAPDYQEEPDILMDEVHSAIRRLKDGKALGVDMISAEILKLMDERGRGILHQLCQRIWKTCTWPEDWTTSVVIPLHKKASTTCCNNYRLIALITHASKIMLYILQTRLASFLTHQIAPEQAGFVKGRGTREQILNVRQLIEKAREYYTPMYLCFVDYEKAFDNVRWPKLWTVLLEMGVPVHLVTLIRRLYEGSAAVIRVENVTSEKCDIRKGVRQGCVLSPLLYNIYSEYIMRLVLDDWKGGIKIGGRTFSNLRFADDTVLIAESEEELLTLLHSLENKSREFGLNINYGKTRVMIVDRENEGRRQPDKVGSCEVVKQFTYLGSTLNNSGSCEPEIRRRIQLARTAMTQLQTLWKDRNLTKATKIQLVKTLVFPIFSYASETWVILAADRRRIDAFEMWCWRRMLRIPWTAKRTNVSILNEIKPEQRLSSMICGRILRFFGHITRSNNVEKLVVQGRTTGKRRRGRSPTRWTDLIARLTNLRLEAATRETDSRQGWRQIVRKVMHNMDRG